LGVFSNPQPSNFNAFDNAATVRLDQHFRIKISAARPGLHFSFALRLMNLLHVFMLMIRCMGDEAIVALHERHACAWNGRSDDALAAKEQSGRHDESEIFHKNFLPKTRVLAPGSSIILQKRGERKHFFPKERNVWGTSARK
jgi:hypothetical protein